MFPPTALTASRGRAIVPRGLDRTAHELIDGGRPRLRTHRNHRDVVGPALVEEHGDPTGDLGASDGVEHEHGVDVLLHGHGGNLVRIDDLATVDDFVTLVTQSARNREHGSVLPEGRIDDEQQAQHGVQATREGLRRPEWISQVSEMIHRRSSVRLAEPSAFG